MEKPKPVKTVKHICPRCTGNGYIKVPNKSVEELKKEDEKPKKDEK